MNNYPEKVQYYKLRCQILFNVHAKLRLNFQGISHEVQPRKTSITQPML